MGAEIRSAHARDVDRGVSLWLILGLHWFLFLFCVVLLGSKLRLGSLGDVALVHHEQRGQPDHVFLGF